jgi:hypothetical protein
MDRSVEDTIIRGGEIFIISFSAGDPWVVGGGGTKKIKLIEDNPKIWKSLCLKKLTDTWNCGIV